MGVKLSSTSVVAFRWVARFCALMVVAGGSVSALGWIANVPRLADWENNGISIKFNPSVCLVIAGFGLFLATYHPRFSTAVRASGGIVSAIAAITVLQTILGLNFGIDTLFFDEPPGAPATLSPGRMGVPASTSFVFLGVALILSTLPRRRNAAALLSLAPLLITALSLAGYSFGASSLYTVPFATGIALQTAAMIFVLAVGLIAAIPDQGIARAALRNDGGGMMLRRILPLLLVVIYAVSWLLLSGVKSGLYDPSFGSAIRVVFETVLLTSVLWWTARHISRAEKLTLDFNKALAKDRINQSIAETQEAERKRISRDLHDDIGQEVTGVRFALERLCNAKIDMPQMLAEVKAVCIRMKELDGKITNIAWQLRPPEIEDGLVDSIRRLGIECTGLHEMAFDLQASNDLPDVPIETQNHIYRIAQESMNNIVKHAKASRIGVTLARVDDELRLTIEDDGVGFRVINPSADDSGFGLIGMRERAKIINGNLEIETGPGRGTTVLVQVPLVADQNLQRGLIVRDVATI